MGPELRHDHPQTEEASKRGVINNPLFCTFMVEFWSRSPLPPSVFRMGSKPCGRTPGLSLKNEAWKHVLLGSFRLSAHGWCVVGGTWDDKVKYSNLLFGQGEEFGEPGCGEK